MRQVRIIGWLVATTLLVAAACGLALLARQQQMLTAERRHLVRLQHEFTAERERCDEANRALAEAGHRLAEAENPGMPAGAQDRERRAELKQWGLQTRKLKQLFENQPSQRIPELQFLTELDWFSLAHRFALDSESDQRRAAAAARHAAVWEFVPLLKRALGDYVASHDGLLPTDVSQLLPFFKTPIDPAILARYTMSGHGPAREHQRGGVDTIVERTPVDEDYDWRHTVRTDGQYSGPWDSVMFRNTVLTARRDYQVAHGGEAAKSDLSLLPYISDPACGSSSKDSPNISRPTTASSLCHSAYPG